MKKIIIKDVNRTIRIKGNMKKTPISLNFEDKEESLMKSLMSANGIYNYEIIDNVEPKKEKSKMKTKR